MTHEVSDIDRWTPELEEWLRRLLGQVADVIDVRLLDEAEKERLGALERDAEDSGAASGIMAFVNEGVQRALESDFVFAVTTGPMFRDPPEPWTIMVDEEDKVIGEWLSESRIAEARESRRCIFLSDDFVMYKDRRPVGKSRFIMPFICLPLEEDSPFSVCGIGSPSPPADEHIRKSMGNPGRDVATLVLGVRLKSSGADPTRGEQDG